MRSPHLSFVALTLFATSIFAAGCADLGVEEEVTPDRTVESVGAPLEAFVVDEHGLHPIPSAVVSLEPLAADGTSAGDPIELLTNTHDAFTFPAMSLEVARVVVEVHLEGELAAVEAFDFADGHPVAKSAIVILTARALCIGMMWASAKGAAGKNDKFGHCVASCRATRWCGGPVGAWTAGILKETLDQLCSNLSPDHWLRTLLRTSKVSACGGWDSQDLLANNRGIACAGRFWQSCDRCCSRHY